MAMSESVHDASPDDGIRVRGAPPTDDVLFADDPSDAVVVCRPATGAAPPRNTNELPYQCQCQPTAAESREFRKRWALLTDPERTSSLRGDTQLFLHTASELLPCHGCRAATETLFHKLVNKLNPLPALVLNAGLTFEDGNGFRLCNAYHHNPDPTLTLFLHHERWASTSLTKYNKTAKAAARVRCPLHAQRARGRPRPAAFEALWNKLPDDQQRHLSHIDSEQFLTDLENYLRRHRFCCRCKEKVLEAYDLLVGSSCSEDDCEDCASFDCSDKHHDRSDYGEELHYTSYLFDELTYSRATNHIVVPCHIDFMSQLMTRADHEIVGDWGDRHARTIAEAQDEVLTCLGIVIWEKMQHLWTRSRTEKRSEELLVHCAVSALRRNFDVAVEALHGKEMMEQLLAEEDDESRRLAKKKEKKKEKKKKRKTATKQKQAIEKSNETRPLTKKEKKKLAQSLSSSSSKTTLSVSEVGSSTHSDDENQSDLDSDDENDDDSEQPSLDEQREMELLSSMGWSGSDQFGLAFPESDGESDEDNPGIPEDEIEFWNRNRSVLASKRLAQRQKLQEKFDLFVLRSNSLN